jgi:hypothetical protein
MNVIPSVGVSGLWSLASPFNSKLLPNIPYTCIAIRKLSDIVAAGGNPEADYYAINGLDNNRYISDLNNGACIITLQGGSGSIVYVPSTSINNYPDIGGVPYTVLALAINLGAIPDSLDLSYLKYRVGDVVRDTIGIQPNVNVVAISPTTLVNDRDAKAIEAARLANIGTVVTDYAKYLQAAAELNSARQKIQELESFILSNSDKLLPDIMHVTPTELAAYTVAQIQALTIADISELSNAQLEALTITQIQALSPEQISALYPCQISVLTIAQIQALTVTQIQALSDTQLNSISASALSGLTASQIASLTNDQIPGISTTQFANLTIDQMSAFTQAQVSVFTSAQLGIYNSIMQINALQEDEIYFIENSWSTIINEGDILYMSQ